MKIADSRSKGGSAGKQLLDEDTSGAPILSSKPDPTTDLPKIRVTLVMPKPLDVNVELFCQVSGRKKLDVVSAAIADFLARNGVADPYRDQTSNIHRLLRGH